MTGDIIKCRIEVETVRFYKDDWGIIIASVSKVDSGQPVVDRNGYITVKGNMAEPKPGNEYLLTAIEIDDEKWGKQYDIKCIATVIDADTTTAFGQKKYLLSLFTEKQVEAMYNALDNPYKTLKDENVQELIKVKGCGITTAIQWITRFNENLNMSQLYIELEQYGLTTNMMKKLLDEYKQPELVIQKVTTNPYILSEVKGIGWKKCDEIAMAGGVSEFSIDRIKAFILYYLNQQAQEGYSYVTPEELMGGIIETIGEDVPDLNVTEAIHGLPDDLWWNEDKTQIGLKKYHNLEENIAKELIRIRDAESNINCEDWEKVVEDIERRQGWQHTDQQRLGIETVMNNNITCIHGLAGTGKTTVANAILTILNNYSQALCALSGKASQRLGEVSDRPSSTIHMLLGYPDRSEEAKQGFFYHDENPLPYDIVVIDEISMIGGYLFYDLLRAIPSGAKVILLGDIGQLESIGECNVAADIISSPEIPTVFLDKIHRQAQKSAIITESIKLRQGTQIIEKDWSGTDTRGELQDLTLDCYSDKSNTYYKVLQHFSEKIEEVKSVLDLQILCPVKFIGDACSFNINNAIQDLYNPRDDKRKELDVFYAKGKVGILREGDKVINVKNNYKTFDPDKGERKPIFNGNIGIIRSIDNFEGTMIIDFQNIGSVFIPKDHVKSIELGYAISVHKSQGSQWEKIICAIDYSSYSLLSRELLYTAITRAQKHCTLVAQNSALRYATMKEGVNTKDTFLVQTLDEIAHPKLVF